MAEESEWSDLSQRLRISIMVRLSKKPDIEAFLSLVEQRDNGTSMDSRIQGGANARRLSSPP